MAAAAVTPFADAAAATAAAEAVESTKARMLAWLALALALYWAGALALWWTHMKPRQREKPQWRWRDIARRARAELQRRFAARAEPPPPLRRHRSGGPPRESRVPDDVRSPALVKRAATSGGRRDAASRSPDVPRRSPGTARRRPIDTPRVRAHESPARKDARRTQRRQPGPRSPDADYAPGGRGKTERRSAAWELAVDARPGGSRKQQSLVASPLRRHSRSAMVAMRPTPSARVAMPGDGDVRVCLMPGDDSVYSDAFVVDLPQRRSLSLPRLPSHGCVPERTQEAGGALRLVYNTPHGVPSARTVEAEALVRSSSFPSARSMCPVVPDWNLWFQDVQRANTRRVSPKASDRSLRGFLPERAQGARQGRHLGRRGERGQGGPGAASCQPQCVDSSDIDAVSDASTIPNRRPLESL